MHSPRPVIALLHGWGMNARMFDGLADLLAGDFDVRALHLPGHGGRPMAVDQTLQAWADDLAAQVPDGATLLGWSLGGQIAMRAALDHPERIARLVLLASTPKFVAAPDWPHGLPLPELEAFGAALRDAPEATLLRFLSLQTRGMPDQRALLHQLRQGLAAAPAATDAALAAGFAILRDSDLRDVLSALAQRTLVVHGALDTLTPAAAGAWLGAALPAARYLSLPRAAHAPHISHREAVAAAIRHFVHD